MFVVIKAFGQEMPSSGDNSITVPFKLYLNELFFPASINQSNPYLLFGRYISENNWRDIYISFKRNNAWSTAQSLGKKIKSDEYEGRPCISPDGKYLFYSKGIPNKIYQVEWKPLLDSLRRSTKLLTYR